MDSEKQECSNASSPPYSFSNGQSKFTEKESNDARNQFSGIVEEEKTRIQKVAEKENERIMKDLRIKGASKNFLRLYHMKKERSEIEA